MEPRSPPLPKEGLALYDSERFGIPPGPPSELIRGPGGRAVAWPHEAALFLGKEPGFSIVADCSLCPGVSLRKPAWLILKNLSPAAAAALAPSHPDPANPDGSISRKQK